MSKKYLAVCPRCHEFYSTHKEPALVKCDECGSALRLVNYDYDSYNAFTDEQKDSFKRVYIEEHLSGAKPWHKPFEPIPASGWVSYIGCCGWIVVTLLVIAGLLTFLSGAYGTGFAMLVAGPASGGALILFSIVAEDVRHIRNRVDEMHHDRKYQ